MKSVVITGTSTGIGYDAARRLLDRGYRVFGSVRRAEDAVRLSDELGEAFVPLLFDVRDRPAVAEAVAEVAAYLDGENLAGLVNNAGVAVPGPLLYLSPDDIRRQFEINVVAVVAVTQAFLPLLGAREGAPWPRGRVINVSSVSGQVAYPFMGPYAASKHALEGLSNSWRRELLVFGVDVVLVAPGSVVTPIWDKAAAEDIAPYEHTVYGPIMRRFQNVMVARGKSGMPVSRVSDAIAAALESPRPRARYALAGKRLTGWLLPRYLPARWFDRLIARQVGLRPPVHHGDE